MAAINCINDEHKYVSKDRRCCDRCPAGSFLKADCDDTKATECIECARGSYLDTKNTRDKCRRCTDCSSTNNQREVKACEAHEDTVCECVTGFYCSNKQCDHCRPVSHCTQGQGVTFPATRLHDTVCGLCEEGTFSNVSDFHSPCQIHTRCEDFGRMVKTPGTRTADAICGDFKYHCHWMLPAGLWSGLVLTALVLLGLICWREKRKSYRTGAMPSTIIPMTFMGRFGSMADSSLDMPLPSTESKRCCQESCTSCSVPLFTPDDTAVSSSIQGSLDSCLPITPLKPSVSFAESSNGNGSTGYCTGTFLRTYSEPQEDEWCGT